MTGKVRAPRSLALASAMVLLVAMAGCGLLPIGAAPALLSTGVPVSNRSEQATRATMRFWQTIHANDYDHVDDLIAELTVAQQADPFDPIVTLLLGMSHEWKMNERCRAGLSMADVQPNLAHAMDLIPRAQMLDPSNRKIPAFINPLKILYGMMHNDPALAEEGYRGLVQATQDYPQFHGFVQGWVLTAIYSPEDPRYQLAMEGFFATTTTCSGISLPRQYPFAPKFIYGSLARRSRSETPCYNSDIAPHNLEGTFLGMGDAYLKEGKLKEAKVAYENIRRIPSYPTWLYQQDVEHRLANLDALAAKFRADSGALDVAQPAMFFFSRMSCTACHAR